MRLHIQSAEDQVTASQSALEAKEQREKELQEKTQRLVPVRFSIQLHLPRGLRQPGGNTDDGVNDGSPASTG